MPQLAAGPNLPLGLEHITRTVLAGLFLVYLLEPGYARGTGTSTAVQYRYYIHTGRQHKRSIRSARLSSVTGGCRDTFTIINTGIIIKLILLYIWIWEYNVVIAHVGTGIYYTCCVRARVCIKTKCTHGFSTYPSVHIYIYIYICMQGR